MQQLLKSTQWKTRGMVLSSVLLICIVAFSGYLFTQEQQLSNDINNLKDEASGLRAEIAAIKENPDVIRYKIISENYDAIRSAIDISKAQLYIDDIQRLERQYGISMNGFSFHDNKLSTGVTAVNIGSVSATDTLKRFIADFRENDGERILENGIYSLSQISSISGNDTSRSIQALFTIEPRTNEETKQ